MISGISLTCFAASYGVALALEASRLLFRAPIRLIVIVAMTLAGLVAQTLYLFFVAHEVSGPPLSSWYDWSLMVAWLVVAAYLYYLLRRPETNIGLFMLPAALGIIAVSEFFISRAPFGRTEALYRWSMVHGIVLLVGTCTVLLGFLSGVMYLIQSYRLKHKQPARKGIQLPSLEFLQRASQESLVVSTIMIGVGLLCGVVVNVIKQATQGGNVPWSDPVVISSGVLFAWLVAMGLFEKFYKPARQGQKIAYLTLANFAFLGIVLVMLWFSGSAHASQPDSTTDIPVRRDTRLDSTTDVPVRRDTLLDKCENRFSVAAEDVDEVVGDLTASRPRLDGRGRPSYYRFTNEVQI